ncbi:hypothetical protein Tco_0909709 [Tanacetum coccineum]|uniref:Uncharacterized protein n=1 Tax=Tanacetum coccineum TaxID=301880 RepID=A0ABQ5CRS4_9ASTR
MLTFSGRGTSTHVLLSMRALYLPHIAYFQLGSRRTWKGDLRIGDEALTCKLYLGLAFTIPTLERVTIWCCEVGSGGGGGGVVGGVDIVYGDGVDRGVGGVGLSDTKIFCTPISLMTCLSHPRSVLLCKASKTKGVVYGTSVIFILPLVLLNKEKQESSLQPKDEGTTNQEKLYLLHMDLCGLMRVASINGNYSRFTWVRFLKTKDEAPGGIISYT